MRYLTHAAIGWLLAAALSGCGSKQPPGAATLPHTAQRAVSPAQTLSRTMVSAVAANKTAAVPVQVKFTLRARPTVATPLDIDVVLLPNSASIDRLSGRIVPGDGLDLVDGADIAATDRPADGVPIEHPVRLLPRREGIFTFDAVITVDSGAATSTETFSMPVIVGAAAAQPPPTAPAGGQPATAAATR